MFNIGRLKSICFASLTGLAVWSVCQPALAAVWRESVVHAVGNYDNESENNGRCKGGDLPSVWGFRNRWLNKMNDTSSSGFDYDDVVNHDNKGVDWSDFVDDDNVEPSGTDWADAILFIGHGSYECDDHPYRSRYNMGDIREDCTATAPQEIRFGDKDANIFISISCHGWEECVFLYGNDGYEQMRDDTQFNVYNAFRGIFYGGGDEQDSFSDYLNGSRTNNVGSDWVLDMTDMYSEYENCAVMTTWGSDYWDAEDVYYNAGFRDYHTSGTGSAVYWDDPDCTPDY